MKTSMTSITFDLLIVHIDLLWSECVLVLLADSECTYTERFLLRLVTYPLEYLGPCIACSSYRITFVLIESIA